jgi:hypothetical protein
MMINLKGKFVKGLSLAMQLMSLVAVMSLAGCDTCKSKDNGLKFTVKFNPGTITHPKVVAKLEVTNSASEFEPTKSEVFIVVSKPVVRKVGAIAATTTTGAYTIGNATGTATDVYKVNYSAVSKEKIAKDKSVNIDFKFTDIDEPTTESVEVEVSIQDKDGNAVSGSPAKLIWKNK